MKLQYLGDTHDFLKYYLLRQLSAVTGRIGVIWMLTPNDQSNNGKVNLHLQKPEKYQALDPELYAKLEDIYKGKDHLQIGYLDAIGLIPKAVYHEEIMPTKGHEERSGYWDRAIRSMKGATLIFVDPDNGMEVRSVSKNSRESGKYIWYDELNRLLDIAPVMIYQHFPREKRNWTIEARVEQLKHFCGVKELCFIQTPQVGFFLVSRTPMPELKQATWKVEATLRKNGLTKNKRERGPDFPPPDCPECHSGHVGEYGYGMPDYEDDLKEDLITGVVVLGGCLVSRDMPRWKCLNCGHQWGKTNFYDNLGSPDK